MKVPLGAAEIRELIPHRYPFLLVDRIVELEPGVRAVGIKNVTQNEPFFQGHFPDYPVMPGVLIIEAMAQVGAVGVMAGGEHKEKLALFAGIDGVEVPPAGGARRRSDHGGGDRSPQGSGRAGHGPGRGRRRAGLRGPAHVRLRREGRGRVIEAGRVAVVTGGTRGIGRTIAMRLAAEGANVAVSYRSNDEAAEETAASVRAEGVKCAVFKGDVASPGDVQALFKGVSDEFGRVDILVNNAGITRDNLMMRMKEDEFDEVLRTNLGGTYLCTRAALRPMIRARWGRIVNVSSVVGLVGNAGQANYAASKAGIIGFTKSVAREVAQRGITANTVAPGYVETELTGSLPEEVKDQIRNQVPMGRFGEAVEVAEVVAFLAGEGAGYVTGQTIAVDGGMTMQ